MLHLDIFFGLDELHVEWKFQCSILFFDWLERVFSTSHSVGVAFFIEEFPETRAQLCEKL